MSAHLQRLYDTAAAAPVAVDARPVQRSSSPLLAVDQRLAMSAYAASFLIGMPGEAEAVSEAWPDLPAELRMAREPDAPAPPVAAPPPPTTPADRDLPPVEWLRPPPQPRPAEATVTDRRTGPEPVLPPPEPPTARADDVPTTRPLPPVEITRPEGIPAPIDQPRPAPEPVPTRTVSLRSELTVTVGPEARRRDAPPPRPRMTSAREPLGAEVRRTDVPELLHPVPAPPAPPLPLPVQYREADLTEPVRRLVREAMVDSRPRTPAQAQDPAPTAAGTTSQPTTAESVQPTTAESVSLIGPLDRPSRATTLYGLRLR
ncbi:hypothetical protein [Nocardia beijingensis]|uniref:hypothetical protein n=1 Tax=Nocardia beijingensis TaxID=95162 RepID=UPI000831DF54|nr:hypothetical protein [Nocardia beijingensis]